MLYGIIHHFPGGTQAQYDAVMMAVHGAKDALAEGQIVHAAGPSAGGFTVFAIHASKESWEYFANSVLTPALDEGIEGGFTAPPQESTFNVTNLLG